jgi:hypothetical protein
VPLKIQRYGWGLLGRFAAAIARGCSLGTGLRSNLPDFNVVRFLVD